MTQPIDAGQLPPYLRSTQEMLRRAYPEGIPEDDYLPLLALLHAHMSFRTLARVMADATGRAYETVYQDVLGAASPHQPGKPPLIDLERVRLRLQPHGFEQWCAEE
jgi:hypothetical protein